MEYQNHSNYGHASSDQFLFSVFPFFLSFFKELDVRKWEVRAIWMGWLGGRGEAFLTYTRKKTQISYRMRIFVAVANSLLS